MRFDLNIGLEIHLKLNTKDKLFCFCYNSEKGSNVNSCYICLGFPGTLPFINEEVIQKAINFSSYFSNCITENLVFDRKHYLYPDLPKGYQITQQFNPLVKNSKIKMFNKSINIERISIEEDAAKSRKEGNKRYIDFNRCGTPLIEMCTSPNFSSVEEVLSFLKILRKIAEKKNIIDPLRSDCIRCDVNVSINKGKKVEIKNVNSLSIIKKALVYEIKRQKEILFSNKTVNQETRTWKEDKTVVMREKESSRDYFFISEYNIPNLRIYDNSENKLLLEDKIKSTEDFWYINVFNWNNFFLFEKLLDVERRNKFLKFPLI